MTASDTERFDLSDNKEEVRKRAAEAMDLAFNGGRDQ